MEQKEIDEIRTAIDAYHKLKMDVREKANAMREEARQGKRNPWTVEKFIDEMNKDLWETDERKKFAEMSVRANNEPEYEKVFGPIFRETFVPPGSQMRKD